MTRPLSEYVGLPWEPHGRGEPGYDCWGLVRLMQREIMGLELPSYDAERAVITSLSGPEGSRAIGEAMAANMENWRRLEPTETARLGDVVLLRLNNSPCHVGFVVENGKMVHIDDGHDSVVERYDALRWRRRVLGVYRYDE